MFSGVRIGSEALFLVRELRYTYPFETDINKESLETSRPTPETFKMVNQSFKIAHEMTKCLTAYKMRNKGNNDA